MINPGSVAGQMPPGDDALIRLIQDLRRDVNELKAQDVLRTAGLIAAPNKLTVQGELDVTGPMVVGGTLSLPAGIIGNAALANPVSPSQFYLSTSGTSLPNATWTTVASQTLTVPTGFTKVLVIASAITRLTYSGTAPVELDANININGVTGPNGSSANGAYVSATQFSQVVVGLTGGSTFVVLEQAYVVGTSSYSTNQAVVEGALIWFR